MSDNICWLITLLYGNELVRCALKMKIGCMPESVLSFPMDPGSRKFLRSWLPTAFRNMGPIVEVKRIEDIVDFTEKGGE